MSLKYKVVIALRIAAVALAALSELLDSLEIEDVEGEVES